MTRAANAGLRRNQTTNFIFNEVPDRASKNSVLCSLYFTVDSFTKAQFDAGFSERLKLKDHAVLTILDQTVMFNNVPVFTDRLICTEYLCVFNLNHSSSPSMRNVGCQTYTTIRQSQQWAGLQSATPIQTERSDEGVKNRTENSLYLFMYKY